MYRSIFSAASAVLAIAAMAQAQAVTIYSFPGGSGGANPSSGVIFGANGSIFGTTPYGGSQGYGTIFELTPNGPNWTPSVLYSFQGGTDGANPGAALTKGTGGAFYGTTVGGGTSGNGTVFQLKSPGTKGGAWTESAIYNFAGNASGSVNVNGTTVTLVSGSPFITGASWNGLPVVIDSVTYTVASVQSASSLTLTASAGTQTGVNYDTIDGSGPQGNVISLSDGNLYGTTSGGGSAGFGTVFRLTPPAGGSGPWTEAVIYSFQGGKDGWAPQSGLASFNGDLFGTTCCGTVGGTVFKLTPAKSGGTWSKGNAYSFNSYATGAFPYGSLAIDTNGIVYGTTTSGGVKGAGILFSLTPPTVKGKTYTLKTIHAFTNGTDGGAPYGGVILDSSGNIYATVTAGCTDGVGGVLQFTPPSGSGSWTENMLYSFTGGQDGSQPYAGVFLLKNVLYGTTVFSMDDAGYGTVFALPI